MNAMHKSVIMCPSLFQETVTKSINERACGCKKDNDSVTMKMFGNFDNQYVLFLLVNGNSLK